MLVSVGFHEDAHAKGSVEGPAEEPSHFAEDSEVCGVSEIPLSLFLSRKSLPITAQKQVGKPEAGLDF